MVFAPLRCIVETCLHVCGKAVSYKRVSKDRDGKLRISNISSVVSSNNLGRQVCWYLSSCLTHFSSRKLVSKFEQNPTWLTFKLITRHYSWQISVENLSKDVFKKPVSVGLPAICLGQHSRDDGVGHGNIYLKNGAHTRHASGKEGCRKRWSFLLITVPSLCCKIAERLSRFELTNFL